LATNLTGKLASTISKVNKIYLQQAPIQHVCRAGWQCLDGDGALFELPNSFAGYTIWRGLGQNLVQRDDDHLCTRSDTG